MKLAIKVGVISSKDIYNVRYTLNYAAVKVQLTVAAKVGSKQVLDSHPPKTELPLLTCPHR